MTRPSNSNRITPRRQLSNFNSIEHLLSAISCCSNIVLITGAGISVSCGIPDFRSKSGIYNTIDCQKIGLPVAELLFDLKFFQMDPEPFYRYASKLIPDNIEPSLSHRFIAELESRNKLLRAYTSNFDGLERSAGVTKCVQSHGTIQSFKCLKCRRKSSLEAIRHDINDGTVPLCPSCNGVLKPEIVFFGELLDPNLLKSLERDSESCDLVIVMGTSLQVGGPVVSFLSQIPRHVPQVLINLNSVSPPKSTGSMGFDLTLLGQCDDVISYLCHCLQWDLSGRLGSLSTLTGSSISSNQNSSQQNDSEDLLIPTQPNERSSKRIRRVPAHLLGEYGVYRDDESLEMTSETLETHQLGRESSLYSARSSQSTSSSRKKRSPAKVIPLTVIVPREIKALRESSGNQNTWNTIDNELCKSVSRGRISTRSKRKLSVESVNGIQWKLTKDRIYRFERIQDDDDDEEEDDLTGTTGNQKRKTQKKNRRNTR